MSRSTKHSSITPDTDRMKKATHIKPPSMFHSHRNFKAQDVFLEEIRKCSRDIRVLFPGEDKFEMVKHDRWNHDDICTPCLIVQPKSSKEVAKFINSYNIGLQKCLNANEKANDENDKYIIPILTVASGKNSFQAMKNGCIVCDLSLMRNVSVDTKNKTCTIEGGARILDLDSKLSDHGLIAVSGICSQSGVVGCILGGGLGYASRKYGLACDNVLSMEVILADGHLKQCTPNTKGRELFWSICGGGGGIAIVVSMTLRCFDIRHSALLTFDLAASTRLQRSLTIRQWANWINGDVDNSNISGEDQILQPSKPAPEEVFSQLILSTESNNIQFLGSSIDTNVIPQSEGVLEQYDDATKKLKRRFPLSSFGNNNSDKVPQLPFTWMDIPGLSDWLHDKLGSLTKLRSSFCMKRYDQLQQHSDQYFHPGNVFMATKFAKNLTNRIVDILIEWTMGERSPKNESKVFIMSAGGAISKQNPFSSFDARDMKYVIMIEGRWNANTNHEKELKEKRKVVLWVQSLVNILHRCEGIQSTPHPESTRDQIRKAGKPTPMGYYNFSRKNAHRLVRLRQKLVPNKVFYLASRVSWDKNEQSATNKQVSGSCEVNSNTAISGINEEDKILNDSAADSKGDNLNDVTDAEVDEIDNMIYLDLLKTLSTSDDNILVDEWSDESDQ